MKTQIPRSRRRLAVIPLIGLALATLLGGCVAYPAYPVYSPYPAYGYATPYYGGYYGGTYGGWRR